MSRKVILNHFVWAYLSAHFASPVTHEIVFRSSSRCLCWQTITFAVTQSRVSDDLFENTSTLAPAFNHSPLSVSASMDDIAQEKQGQKMLSSRRHHWWKFRSTAQDLMPWQSLHFFAEILQLTPCARITVNSPAANSVHVCLLHTRLQSSQSVALSVNCVELGCHCQCLR